MSSAMLEVVRWVQSGMGEAHRGVLPHKGKLVAFGNRGTDEVVTFSEWLNENGYEKVAYAAEGGSWAMVIVPHYRMRDTRRVQKALWDASPDSLERKTYQASIAFNRICSLYANLGFEVTDDWFTRAQVSKFGLVQPDTTLEDAAPVAVGDELSLN